jgi:hypothetical protein
MSDDDAYKRLASYRDREEKVNCERFYSHIIR